MHYTLVLHSLELADDFCVNCVNHTGMLYLHLFQDANITSLEKRDVAKGLFTEKLLLYMITERDLKLECYVFPL